MDRGEVEGNKNKQRTRPISNHSDRTSLVNIGFIIRLQGKPFFAGPTWEISSGKDWPILPARVVCQNSGFASSSDIAIWKFHLLTVYNGGQKCKSSWDDQGPTPGNVNGYKQVYVFLHNIALGAKENEAMKEKRRRGVLSDVSSNSLPGGSKFFWSPLYVKRNQIKGTSLLHG